MLLMIPTTMRRFGSPDRCPAETQRRLVTLQHELSIADGIGQTEDRKLARDPGFGPDLRVAEGEQPWSLSPRRVTEWEHGDLGRQCGGELKDCDIRRIQEYLDGSLQWLARSVRHDRYRVAEPTTSKHVRTCHYQAIR